MEICANCPTRVSLLRCGGCCTEVYCSVACQHAARALHAPFCRGVVAKKPWRSVTGLECCPYCRANARVPAAALLPVVKFMADSFYRSTVLEDGYPSESSEGFYGIKMNTALGTLVFGCWQRLLSMGSILTAGQHPTPYVCPAAVAAALAAGTMPALFERAVRGLAAFTSGGSPAYVYLQRMVEHGFADIPYDREFQLTLAAKCSSSGFPMPPVPMGTEKWHFSDAAPAQVPGLDIGGGFSLF